MHAGPLKPAGYYGQDRAELVTRLPRPLGRVLDVGCGEGGAGRRLREAGASWLAGVELEAGAAAVAASAGYDEVASGAVEEELAGKLRSGDPAVVGIVRDGVLLLDCRTLSDAEVDEAARAVLACRSR